MNRRSLRQRGARRAFTLIELLVSMAVMALVLVLVGQIISSVLQTTQIANQRLDSAARARAVLQAIGRDLESIVSERGLTVFTQHTSSTGGQNLQLAFLTRGRPPEGAGSNTPTASRFLAVDYQLSDGDLQRRYISVKWDDYDLLKSAVSARAVNSYSIISRGILRLEAVAVLDNGDIMPITGSGDFESNTVNGEGIQNDFTALKLAGTTTEPRYVRAIIIAVAAIDDRAIRLLGARFDEVAGKLGAPSAGKTPVEVWDKDLASLDGSYPAPAISSIYFAQSTFVLK